MAAGIASKYDIARFTGVCAASGSPIEPGDTYIAALIEPEPDSDLIRRDYLPGAWESSPVIEGLFACWRTRRREKEDKANPLIDNEELVALFDSLSEPASDRQLSFRYALALLLIRKRLLRQVGVRRTAEEETLLLKRWGAANEAPVDVQRPHLDAARCAALVEELSTVLRDDA